MTKTHFATRIALGLVTMSALAGSAFAEGAAAPGSPDTRADAAPAPETPARLHWFGFGLRVGGAQLKLQADSLRGQLGETGGAVGAAAAERISDLRHQLRVVTPTLHFGGEHFFFKLEAPLGTNASLKTYGVGLYPVNYGYFFSSLGLFPYASAGVVGNYVVARAQPGATGTSRGGFVQGRIAVGLKWRPFGLISASLELGYSPYALGLVGGQGDNAQQSVQAGKGHVIDQSFGLELL